MVNPSEHILPCSHREMKQTLTVLFSEFEQTLLQDTYTNKLVPSHWRQHLPATKQVWSIRANDMHIERIVWGLNKLSFILYFNLWPFKITTSINVFQSWLFLDSWNSWNTLDNKYTKVNFFVTSTLSLCWKASRRTSHRGANNPSNIQPLVCKSFWNYAVFICTFRHVHTNEPATITMNVFKYFLQRQPWKAKFIFRLLYFVLGK